MKFTHIIDGMRVQTIRWTENFVYVVTEFGEQVHYKTHYWVFKAERLPLEDTPLEDIVRCIR